MFGAGDGTRQSSRLIFLQLRILGADNADDIESCSVREGGSLNPESTDYFFINRLGGHPHLVLSCQCVAWREPGENVAKKFVHLSKLLRC